MNIIWLTLPTLFECQDQEPNWRSPRHTRIILEKLRPNLASAYSLKEFGLATQVPQSFLGSGADNSQWKYKLGGIKVFKNMCTQKTSKTLHLTKLLKQAWRYDRSFPFDKVRPPSPPWSCAPAREWHVWGSVDPLLAKAVYEGIALARLAVGAVEHHVGHFFPRAFGREEATSWRIFDQTNSPESQKIVQKLETQESHAPKTHSHFTSTSRPCFRLWVFWGTLRRRRGFWGTPLFFDTFKHFRTVCDVN